MTPPTTRVDEGRATWKACLKRPVVAAGLIAVLATLTVLCQLDPCGDHPGAWAGPGLTVDEIFNVELGVQMADRFLSGDLPGYAKATKLLPDHPPLGRLWLGGWHELSMLVWPSSGTNSRLSVACARVGTAVAFGLLIWWLGASVGQRHGLLAGMLTALIAATIPRVYGHAHIASLETLVNLSYCGTLLAITCWWNGDAPPSLRASLATGVLLGLALLTKIHGILLLPVVGIWALLRWRHRTLLPLLVWGVTGFVVFFIGWPWLWDDPVGHTGQYLGHAVKRASIQVWYLGQTWSDKAVPWHYPWVIFATTMPIAWLCFGIRHLWSQRQSLLCSEEGLLLGGCLLPLILFSLPGIAVYDGERLFLMCYPLWACLAGPGLASLMNLLLQKRGAGLAYGLTLVLLSIPVGRIVQLSPSWLSDYNWVIGGLSGASRLGFQESYWGDALTRDLLREAALKNEVGQPIFMAPELHQYQLPAMLNQSPELQARSYILKAWNPAEIQSGDLVLVFFRHEYLPREWSPQPSSQATPLREIRRSGVLLAGLYRWQSHSTDGP